jgi:hypothetical protein
MKLAQVIKLAAAGDFLAKDKTPEGLLLHLMAEDRKAKDRAKDEEEDKRGGYDKARDESEEAEDAMGEACDSKAAAMDAEEEESDKTKGEDAKAKDRKAARDSRKAARDSRKAARDSRKAARDKRAKDSNLDPEHTNDNNLENAETGTPAKGGKSESGGALDSATVSKMIADAVTARDELHAAAREVEPIIGLRAFDSATNAYKAALEHLGVDLNGVPPSAYRSVLKIAKDRAGAVAAPTFAMDSADEAELRTLIPHLNRL